jgi:hypothetical protein
MDAELIRAARYRRLETRGCAMSDHDDATANAVFETVAGVTAVVAAGFAAAAVFPSADSEARVVLVALAAGVLSALLTDWRACTAVTVIAALVFVGFLTHRYGTLTGNPGPWSFTPLIGLGALTGRGYRRMVHRAPAPIPLDAGPARSRSLPHRPVFRHRATVR